MEHNRTHTMKSTNSCLSILFDHCCHPSWLALCYYWLSCPCITGHTVCRLDVEVSHRLFHLCTKVLNNSVRHSPVSPITNILPRTPVQYWSVYPRPAAVHMCFVIEVVCGLISHNTSDIECTHISVFLVQHDTPLVTNETLF